MPTSIATCGAYYGGQGTPQDSRWESELAEVLESMPEVAAHAKNQGLNLGPPVTS